MKRARRPFIELETPLMTACVSRRQKNQRWREKFERLNDDDTIGRAEDRMRPLLGEAIYLNTYLLTHDINGSRLSMPSKAGGAEEEAANFLLEQQSAADYIRDRCQRNKIGYWPLIAECVDSFADKKGILIAMEEIGMRGVVQSLENLIHKRSRLRTTNHPNHSGRPG